jgi:predicted NAD/FAD-binding protein
MPFDNRPAPQPRRSIAVVGSGISGMSAAWLLAQGHDVTVYEKDGRVGGHTNTVIAETPGGPIAVDTGFIVYNPPAYPNLVRLFDHLGVETHDSDMSFAVSLGGGALEYAGTSLATLLAQPANAVRPRFWRMMADLVRFYRSAPGDADDPALDGLTLGDYLSARGYSDAFADDHLLPMAGAIWSTAAADMRAHSARAFIRFFKNHALFNLGSRPIWRTVTGGSRRYAEALTAAYRDSILTARGARRIGADDDGRPVVEDVTGERRTFDRVVIATHADEALALLDDPSDAERDLLGRFAYAANTAVLHADASRMPKRRAVWSSWNVVSDARIAADGPISLVYWMNRLQSLDPRHDLFVSLNPETWPDERTVHTAVDYTHPIFNTATHVARQSLWTLQGHKGRYYCGSYFGDGFHEDGLQSGLWAAELAGGLARPWSCADQNGRIVTGNDPGDASAPSPAESRS